jgi:hypothetical protein
MKGKCIFSGRLSLAIVFFQIAIAWASTENVESKYCLYTDLPGWLELETGVQDLAFMWLCNTRPIVSIGLNSWHWYYSDNKKYYHGVVRSTGAVPSAFHAWEANGTFELVIPYSYMHSPFFSCKHKESSLFKQPQSLSFSGWVFGASPGITAYVPKEKNFRVDLFGTLSPYVGMQVVEAKHMYLGIRLGYQFARQLRKESFIDRIEQKWFASIFFGIAGR